MSKVRIENRIATYLGALLIVLILAGCQDRPVQQGEQYKDGQLPTVFNLSQPQLDMPINIDDYLQQVTIIEQRSPSLYKNNQAVYEAVNRWIKSNLSTDQFEQFGLNSYQLSGQDHWGNLLFTGYYTPVLQAREQADEQFRYPLYAKPTDWQGQLPSREQIYNGIFDNKKLAIAYTRSLIDNFIMEVQGSGYIDFENGEPLSFLAYNGKNGHGYQSIGRLLIEQCEIKRENISMQAIKAWADKQDEQTVINLLKQNPSTVFFQRQSNAKVVGSGNIPLIAKASVASDTSLIPTGSVILMDVPLLNKDGVYEGKREIRLMIALDVGGAIKGQHLDIYQGIGDEAGHQAGFYNHYGRVWLIAQPPNQTVN